MMNSNIDKNKVAEKSNKPKTVEYILKEKQSKKVNEKALISNLSNNSSDESN